MKKHPKKDKLPRTSEMVQERMRQSRAAGIHDKKAARSTEERQAIKYSYGEPIRVSDLPLPPEDCQVCVNDEGCRCTCTVRCQSIVCNVWD